MPDSATRTAVSGMAPPDPHGALVVDLEGDEVALVHPDERRPTATARSSSGLVVHLDQHVEPDVEGQRVQLAELVVVERGGDQQHRVGAHDAGVAHVGRAPP